MESLTDTNVYNNTQNKIQKEARPTADGRIPNEVYDVRPQDQQVPLDSRYTYGLFSKIFYNLSDLTGINTTDVLATKGDPVAFDIRSPQCERITQGRNVFEHEQDMDLESILKNATSSVQTTTGEHICRNDDENSLTAGIGGAVLMTDHHLRDKLTHFDHEEIPERKVHARGSGAFGKFVCTRDMHHITQLAPLQHVGKTTDIFVRFSQVAGSKGSFDTARDARGFAIKFYTEQGNWDIVGNAQPVFFVQDGMQFPDLVHSVKPEPNNGMPQATAAHDNFWDFISQTPAAAHMIMWAISDSGVVRSYRTMEGYAVHTFKVINTNGDVHFVKILWKPQLGMQSLSNEMAEQLRGINSDYLRRDLWEALERGFYPKWDMLLQIMREEDSEKFPFDILDATKIWPVRLFPPVKVGEFVLNRNVDNFFAQTEQSTFHPGNLIPGIEVTNDPLLQVRLFSYIDTQLNRHGSANFNELPINRPIIPVENNQRDGFMRYKVNRGSVNYAPNTSKYKSGPTMFCPFTNKRANICIETREKSEKFNDFYSQATARYISLSEEQRKHMIRAFHYELGHVWSVDVRKRMIDYLARIHPDLSRRVKRGLVPWSDTKGEEEEEEEKTLLY